MIKNEKNLILLNVVFVTSLIIANIVGVKVVSIFGLTVTAAIGCYAVTYLCTDVIGEIWGKTEANNTVKYGIVCQILACIMILIGSALPYAPHNADFKAAFDAVLSQNFRFVCASMAAYISSQMWDVFVFHRIKAKTGQRHKWLRNNLSTMSSQLIDTALFITIAFAGQVDNLPFMVVSQYFVKFLLAALDTPFFYLMTRKRPARA